MKMSKRLAVLLLAGILIPQTALAATHDSTEDISSDTATITLGKILTVNQGGKFPNINDFRFEVEAVTGWDNANIDTTANGAAISPANMPKPEPQTTDHHQVTVSGNKATVTLGDFRSGTSSARGVADTSFQKLRTTDVNIKFAKAGYYMYKVTETASVPDSVPGVTYDDNSYYVVVYVCNRTDSAGNTTGGVYVHNITSWRNASGDDTKPNLSDIANTTDNGGTAASDNTAGNYSKVGASSGTVGTDSDVNPTGPNRLAAYRFWNEQNTHDIVLTNNVTGNLGDTTKDFEFEVTLTGLEKGYTYTTDVPTTESSPQSTSDGTDLISGSKGTINAATKTITADSSGSLTFTAKLKDDEKLVLNAIPVTAKYSVNEKASDHVASFVASSDDDEADIALESKANTRDNTALQTDEETVDSDDGTVTIAFTNNRNLATPTGIPAPAFPAAALVILAAGPFAAVRRKRKYNSLSGTNERR